jgi:hypothetical protein
MKSLNELKSIAHKKLSTINKIFHTMDRMNLIQPWEIFYRPGSHIKFFADFASDLVKMPNLYNNYKNLILGLDDESIFTVSNALRNVILLADKTKEYFDIWTDKEKYMCKIVHCELYRRILQLDSNIYVWKNYYLPINYFGECVFWERCGIPHFSSSTLNKVRNKNIIDVGGFSGDSALILKEYTDKKVYSFEPVSKNYDIMLSTISLNDEIVGASGGGANRAGKVWARQGY